MKIWVDAQLPATLANWLTNHFGLEAAALRDLSLRDAQDMEIFEAARAENAVIMTKDSDFIDLGVSKKQVEQFKFLPWAEYGNSSHHETYSVPMQWC